jgi:hypothetical protein
MRLYKGLKCGSQHWHVHEGNSKMDCRERGRYNVEKFPLFTCKIQRNLRFIYIGS